MTFGKLLASRRKELGLYQKDIAKTVGVAVSTVNNWENDVNLPYCDKFAIICDLLDVPFSYFLSLYTEDKMTEDDYEIIDNLHKIDKDSINFIKLVIKREVERAETEKKYQKISNLIDKKEF
jgi:transcriptional regulator with XRE-family HTH domain